MAEIRGMSLFTKTGLVTFCLFGVVSTLASLLTAWTLYEHMTREYTSKGEAIARSIAGASQEILLNRDAATVQAMIDMYQEIEGVAYVFVIDWEGVVVSHTFVPEVPKALREAHEYGSMNHRVTVDMDVEPIGRVIDISEPVLGGVAGHVHVGMDKELIVAYFWQAVIRMQILLFFVFWGCVGVLYLMFRRISRPLGQLTEYARRLAGHDFSATIDINTRDEIDLLGRAMQSMSQELALLFSEMGSEVNKATADLRDNMAYLSAIIDNLADGLLVVGVSGEITVVNPAMREFYDLGSPGSAMPSFDDFPGEIADMAKEIRHCGSDVLSSEVPLTRGRTGKAVGSPIFVTEPIQQCLGGVILVRDITREKELDQLKTDFISTVSHELRTPMTSVLGFSKIIKKKLEQSIFPLLKGNDEVQRPISQVRGNMRIIVSEAERLTELINDVLDIARMEAGELLWREERVSMRRVLEQSIESTRGLWAAKGLKIETDIEADLPDIHGDHARLVQVVVNLLSNAIKFTEVSPIRCTAVRDNGSVRVSVADKGAGIKGSDLAMIFDKFKQVGDTLTSKPEGSGLGLPICRQIVDHHGGRIWAESVPGNGSVFTFSIPEDRPERDGGAGEELCLRLDQPGAEGIEGAHGDDSPLILVVDDDPVLSGYLAQVFEEMGLRVCEAANGPDAIRAAQLLLPDLITMDIMMPGMTGHEAIARLRHNPATRHIPILVITALSGEDSRSADMSLVKPVDGDTLAEAARALLGKGSERGKSCIVLGESGACDLEGLMVMCAGEVSFVTVDEFWVQVEQGFRGTVFVPAEECEAVELEKLTRLSGVSVVILPAHRCD